MIRHPNWVRALAASTALAAALALGGCKTDNPFAYNARANAPLSSAMLAELEQKNMSRESPILVRLFKEESELEVWKQDRAGRYALLKTYPICRWSGELGPKIKEGDRQAPEGFYSITPGQMNPNSQYYLAFNLGYPNAYDQAWGRTGAHLMVHGDCSSRGCYAMSDEQISEIFALGRESFFGGQQAFQVQAYPFRMTPQNMAKHRNSPHLAFWKMLKRGNDHFEVTRLEPKVDVCEKRYVFNAQSPDDPAASLKFTAAGKCPAYEVPREVESAVNDKQRQDEIKTAELVSRGTPVAPIKTGQDGGMHPAFVAKLQPRQIVDERGNLKLVVDKPNPEIAATVASTAYESTPPERLPAEPAPIQVADVPIPRIAPQAKVGARPEEPSFADRLGSLFKPATPAQAAPARVASADASEAPNTNTGSIYPQASQGGNGPKEAAGSKISRKLGLRSDDGPEQTKTNAPAREERANGAIRPKQDEAAETRATASANGGLLNGAQPIMSSSFDSRWGAFR